jgi:hypothetical protein
VTKSTGNLPAVITLEMAIAIKVDFAHNKESSVHISRAEVRVLDRSQIQAVNVSGFGFQGVWASHR